MPQFHYRALTGKGETVEGSLEAENEAQVVGKLRGLGQLPIAVEPQGAGGAGARSGRPGLQALLAAPVLQRGRIRRRELALITRELATLLQAGLTVDQSLRLLAELASGEPVRRVMTDLLEQIQGGATLSAALARHQAVFPGAYVSMVRAGETGGALSEVLASLAAYLERAEAFAEQIRSALVYPALLLVMSGLSILLLLTVVLPQFTPFFADAGTELPLITRTVIQAGELARAWWWLGLLLVVALLLGLRAARQRPEARARLDRWLLRLPLLGSLLAKIDTARLARTLGTLLGNGVPLPSALAIAQNTMANAALREAVAQAAAAAKEGRGLGRPLAQSGLLPRLATHLVTVGEESGQLAEMLIRIAEIFDSDVRATTERLMTLLVPGLTIALGLIIATIIGAVLSAILAAYDLPL